MNRILGLIPARAGSRGVPGKNHKLLNGQPLITYTIQSAIGSELLTKLMLSSNCLETIRITSGFPQVEVPFTRPAYLATDEAPTLPVIQHAVRHYVSLGINFDYVCLLQPTTPFRGVQLIDRAISHLLSKGGESLVSVKTVPARYNPYWGMKLNEHGCVQAVITGQPWITRRQDLPHTVYRDGQLYISSTSMILQGRLMDEDTIGFTNNESPDINIDGIHDWEMAENWVRNGK